MLLLIVFLLLFSNNFFSMFRHTTSVSNGLNPDQDRRYVGPDLGLNCLQSLSADDNSSRRCSRERVKGIFVISAMFESSF